MGRKLTDAIGKTPDERFAEIRRYFLDSLELAGQSRRELYYRPKPGDAREPTEEEVVRRWANMVQVPVNDIFIGIQRAFATAPEQGHIVNFRYCVPHIMARVEEKRDARAGL